MHGGARNSDILCTQVPHVWTHELQKIRFTIMRKIIIYVSVTTVRIGVGSMPRLGVILWRTDGLSASVCPCDLTHIP